jgi:hypothetical protein
MLVFLAACGGSAPPAAAAPATPEGGAAAAAPGKGASKGRGGELPPPQLDTNTELMRETFGYRSSGRDPFLSLLKSASVRPLITDLRIVGINYDPRYPAQSVVTLQDTTLHKRYTLKVSDQVGRIHVTEIRAEEVVLTIQEFGAERQVVLALKRRPEEAR